MNVCSIEWLLGLTLVSAVFSLLPSLRQRQGFFALCSFGFLSTQVAGLRAWGVLFLFLGTGFLVAKRLTIKPARRLIFFYLIILVMSFCYIKQYSFFKAFISLNFFPNGLIVVGLSYMLFRQIHLVVDAYQGQIENLTFWNYVNYQLNPFGLQAGPIQRYQDFCEYWTRLTPILPDAYEILKAFFRIFLGVFKIMALASGCLAYHKTVSENYFNGPGGFRVFEQFLMLLYLFPAYLYFNFSGYCDMVIGGASLVGIRMPENFCYPFISRNLGELWTRWHRTLGFWIRDYLFTPIFKSSVERWPQLATSLSFVSYFLAFSIAGVWHGSSWNFLVFGLLNGLGVAAAKLWEMLIIRRRGRAGLKAYLQSAWARAIAIVITIHYFAFTLFFFAEDIPTVLRIFKRLGSVF